MFGSFTEAALAAYAKLAKDKYAEKHRRVQGTEHLDNGAIDGFILALAEETQKENNF